MAFIDIFNYKKYFAKSSDAQVARIGHVNKLAAHITAPARVAQLNSINDNVTINAYSGVIEMFDNFTAPSDLGATFRVDNDKVTANSVVLVSIETGDYGDLNDNIKVSTRQVQDGLFYINFIVSSTTSFPLNIHFLVIS
jgi:hypothetical protein